MSSTFKIAFYIRRNYINKHGRCSIMIRVSVNGKKVEFSSKLEVPPHLWEANFSRMIGKSAEAQQVNNDIDDIIYRLNSIFRTLSQQGVTVNAERIRNMFLGATSENEMLIVMMSEHIKENEQLIGINKSEVTVTKFKVVRSHLMKFIKCKYNISDINVNEITFRFITDFETYLRITAGCNTNTIGKIMQYFKRITTLAKNNGILLNDPFAKYKIKSEKVDRGFLTNEELDKLAKKCFTIERLDNVRDMFLFSCMTGLAYVDMKNLERSNIVYTGGKLWISTFRQKSRIPVNVPILPLAQLILDKYDGKLKGNKILPMLSNQKCNSYLKEIGDLCGIEKSLTFHLARHTFATTTTLTRGVPIESVSSMLGHTNISTTQIYAKITNEKIKNDMDNITDKFDDLYNAFSNKDKKEEDK